VGANGPDTDANRPLKAPAKVKLYPLASGALPGSGCDGVKDTPFLRLSGVPSVPPPARACCDPECGGWQGSGNANIRIATIRREAGLTGIRD